MMPTQKPVVAAPAAVVPPPTPPAAMTVVSAPQREEEGVIQFSLSMRKELRKQLARLASDADMTMRAFVLNALKEKGLSVRDDDLIDLRKERNRS
ncbi:hypothetical protein WOA01_24010 [Methylocystis sp. IM2]|uniref:hypothetical protein n=1 Tax=Methylocystis sp. IM2 TaxID=3136563 RepID=UPI0030F8C5D1